MTHEEISELDAKTAATIVHTCDTEQHHKDADAALCELLFRLGFTRTVEAFHKLDKWYS